MLNYKKFDPKQDKTDQVDDFGGTKYKFILLDNHVMTVPIFPHKMLIVSNKEKQYIRLEPNGRLTIFAGYAWDGVSGGISIQSDTNLRGGLVHDALYQLVRMGLLGTEERATADKIFYDILLTDGMNRVRAYYYYTAVRLFGGLFS
jgi:hypothetical protein